MSLFKPWSRGLHLGKLSSRSSNSGIDYSRPKPGLQSRLLGCKPPTAPQFLAFSHLSIIFIVRMTFYVSLPAQSLCQREAFAVCPLSHHLHALYKLLFFYVFFFFFFFCVILARYFQYFDLKLIINAGPFSTERPNFAGLAHLPYPAVSYSSIYPYFSGPIEKPYLPNR